MSDYVFTALFGGYESLNELEITKSATTEYVCFTDDSQIRSSTWKVIVVQPKDSISPARSSRQIKMLGHKLLPMHSRSLYIDNSVKLLVDGKEILDEWLIDSDVSMMKHYRRKTVRGEFFACSTYGLDRQDLILEQFREYQKTFPEILNERPFWGGMIARTNSKSADKLMNTWKQQFDRYSKRDQLSINVSSSIANVPIRRIDAENDTSQWHEWPIHLNRKVELRESVANKNFKKLRMVKNVFLHGRKYYL